MSHDRVFYDEVELVDLAQLEPFIHNIRGYVERYQRILEAKFRGRKITVADLGAGTCTTSLVLSRLEIVEKVICADISTKRMEHCMPQSAKHVEGCRPEKLSLLQSDFGSPLNLENQSVDVVLFDAALHHSRSMWFTLDECARVLKPDGVLVAQREQYLGILTFALKLDRLLQTPEVRAGVAENAYLRKQYEYYLRATGFRPRFIASPETWLQKLLRPLNGLIWSKWIIIAEKQGDMSAA